MNTSLSIPTNRAAVSYVAGVVPKTSKLPCLTHVRLSGNEDEVTVAATNMDVTLAAILIGDVSAGGKPCLLPGQKFADFFKKGRGERIKIESNCDKAAVTVDGNTFSLRQHDEEDYPKTPWFDPDYAFTIPGDVLENAVRRVVDAQSEDDTRYILNGILFELSTRDLTLVATDGRRLHRIRVLRNVDMPWESRLVHMKDAVDELYKDRNEKDKEGTPRLANYEKARLEYEDAKAIKFIVQCNTVPHLLKLLKAARTSNVEVDYKAAVTHPSPLPDEPARIRITADTQGFMLVAKCIIGDYPNYRQVIPDQVKEQVDVDVEAWLSALRTVEPFTTEKSNSVKFKFTKNLLTLTAGLPDTGTGSATVLVKFNGPDQAMSYNPKYIIEALAPMKDDPHVKFGFTDELIPCLIVSNDMSVVVMPMRLS